MPDGAASQNNSNPGDGGGDPNAGGDGKNTGQQKTATTTPPAPAEGAFDPAKLTQEEINQVLEKNPLIWKTDRLAGLRDKASKYEKAELDRQEAEKKALADQGKFKDLSEQQAQTIENLQKQIQDGKKTGELTAKLLPLGVIDLEGALKLVDRSKIEISEDGVISGVDEAIEALKTDRAYLFNASQGKPSVGAATNPANAGGTGEPPKYKASQMRGPEGAEFYKANREDILKAQAEGRIEQD